MNLKAIIMAGIMMTTAASFAVPPTVSGVSARQRYPWNGLIDVDVAFEGPTGNAYRIELSATDRVGGTNLAVATVWRVGAESAVGNPVDLPAPGTHRLVWDAAADLPAGFVADRVVLSAKLLNPIWSFESIPAIDTSDVWAPETVYHDVQTVASYGEIEDHAPAIRCLTDEWHLEDTLGANVVFSGSSMGLHRTDSWVFKNRSPITLWVFSESTNVYRMVDLDYETGSVIPSSDVPFVFQLGSGADVRFFQTRDESRRHAVLCRPNGHDVFLKSVGNGDVSFQALGNRYLDDEHGSAVCGYCPNGIPLSDSSSTSISSYGKGANAALFFSGTAGTDVKEAIVLSGGSAGVRATSKYSCMKNPTGRYVVPMLDGENYFTVGHGNSDTNLVQFHRLFTGHFAQFNNESFDLGHRYREDWPTGYDSWPQADKSARNLNWVREPSVAYSKGVAMPDGRRIFLGGAGRDADGKVRMWQDGTNVYGHANYPAGHPFESWARRDITCLLPNGKFCGVDEELGLVVVNPLTGEMYVASDDPVFKKGKMGCQLLPNGKVWIIPYDCEGREFEAGLALCGKLYEVDFGFTKSFSLSSLCSPYLKVAEGDPEPSGIKIGLDPNGGELPGVYAQYYKGANPKYGTLPTPTRSGHAFRGWSTDGTEAGIVGAGASVPGSGIQLKAVWRANPAAIHKGTQLWAGGPYWAETNLGAEKPEDFGLYFWWGDIIGYKRENGKWVASDGSKNNFSFKMGGDGSSTSSRSALALQSAGWIDGSYILVPKHDAAHVHWGGGWRLPTPDELSALNNKCDWTWTTRNGVKGYVVYGRGSYSNVSIFLPAAGCASDTSLGQAGTTGYYWSSEFVPNGSAFNLQFNSGERYSNYYNAYSCYFGFTVRPVRESPNSD